MERTVNIPSSLPMGMTDAYLDKLKPALVLRTWIRVTKDDGNANSPPLTHGYTLRTSKDGGADVDYTVSLEESGDADTEMFVLYKDVGAFTDIT